MAERLDEVQRWMGDVYWTVDRDRAERCWHDAQQFVGEIKRMLQAGAEVR